MNILRHIYEIPHCPLRLITSTPIFSSLFMGSVPFLLSYTDTVVIDRPEAFLSRKFLVGQLMLKTVEKPGFLRK